MATTTFTAPNIKCGGCAETVTNALKPLDGVLDVQVDVSAKRIDVRHDSTVTDQQMKEALTQSGFPAA